MLFRKSCSKNVTRDTYSNTTEQGENDDERRVQQHRNESTRRQSGHHLSQSHGENLRDQNHEEVVTRTRRVHVEAGDVVDGQEEADGAQYRVRHLGENHRQSKGQLTVSFGCCFAVVDQAAEIVLGLDLSENQSRQDGDLEDDEDAVLQRGSRVVELQEHESSEEGDGDVVEKSGEAVVGRAPEGLLLAFVDDLDLMPQRCGKFLGRSLWGIAYCL